MIVQNFEDSCWSGHNYDVNGLDGAVKGGAEMRRNCAKKFKKVLRNIRLTPMHDRIWQVQKVVS